MYCGFLKKECNDLTVGELIDILERNPSEGPCVEYKLLSNNNDAELKDKTNKLRSNRLAACRVRDGISSSSYFVFVL